MSDAELACDYIVTRVRAAAGSRWLQGEMRPVLATRATTPGVRLFAEHRLWRLDRGVRAPGWAQLESDFDQAWADDFAHVAADMNGSPVFLFAALKMKLKMAVRRALARKLGKPAPTGGPLDPVEAAAFADALDALLDLLDIRGDLRDAARATNTKRDAPEPALAIEPHFRDRAAFPGTCVLFLFGS